MKDHQDTGHQDTGHQTDQFDLSRFVAAQQDCYNRALSEIRGGSKRTHWMWFIFPQYRGLGTSAMSRRYAIKSLSEAQAYLDHPVLGPRLTECAEAALRHEGTSAEQIFGSPDDLKLHSSATLFAIACSQRSVFDDLLDAFFSGQRDEQTVALIDGD